MVEEIVLDGLNGKDRVNLPYFNPESQVVVGGIDDHLVIAIVRAGSTRIGHTLNSREFRGDPRRVSPELQRTHLSQFFSGSAVQVGNLVLLLTFA